MSDYLSQEISRIQTQITELQQLAQDPEMKQLADDEIKQLQAQKQQLEQVVESANTDKQSDSNGTDVNPNIAIIEIRPAAGGEESKLFTQDLLRMYTRYAQNKNWKTSIIDENTIKIKGKQSFAELQYEAGVHRVQRVPQTESQGRIHTSTVTVAVLPEIKPTQVELKNEDIDFVAFKRSSGAGGQNVNKVATAVRLHHRPSGITVECNQDRTQFGNREIAMQLLAAKLWDLQEQQRQTQLGEARSAIGRGMRAEKIRTFNYPQNRVTDHRINQSWHNLDQVIDGNLDDIITALQQITNVTTETTSSETESTI